MESTAQAGEPRGDLVAESAKAATSAGAAKRDLPLRFYLLILTLAVLMPALLASGLILGQFYTFQSKRSEETALLMAHSVATTLDHHLQSSIETMLALAQGQPLVAGDLEGFHRVAVHTLGARGLHVLLRTVDERQVLNTRVPWGTELPKIPFDDFDRKVVDTGQPQITDLLYGPVAKDWVFGVEVPVLTGGAVSHVLTMSTDAAIVAKLLADKRRSDDWTIKILDSQGRIIAQLPDHAQNVAKDASADADLVGSLKDGVQRLGSGPEGTVVAHSRLEEADWLVLASISTRAIDGPWLTIWWLYGLIGTALTALCVPLAVGASRQVTLPIAAATAMAAKVGHGELVVPVHTPLREANDLVVAIASASKELHARALALARSELRFRSVFEQAAVGFEQTTLDGRYLGINNRLCKMLGYTREECEQKSFQVLTHPEDWPAEAALIEKLKLGEIKSYDLEKRLITKSGKPIWVRLNTALVRDLDGTLLYRTAVVEDITERRQAAVTTARLAAIVQSSADAKISLSLDSKIETWNPAAERMFGYTADEVIGKSPSILCPPELQEQQADILQRALAGQTSTIETVRLRKDGTAIDVSLRLAPIVDEHGTIAIAATLADVGVRKRHERQIELLNRELLHRVKNSLAVIQSIANQTMRTSPDPEAFRVAFQGRLQALSAANELLMSTSWGGAGIEEFLDRSLAPLIPTAARRLRKSGPSVAIPAELGIPLGLALHELGTNAVKYGSWSNPDGWVEISWRTERVEPTAEAPVGTRLILTWTERGGPRVVAPKRSGFGSVLIERGIPDARVERRFEPDGFVCVLDLPLEFPATTRI